MKTPLLAGIGLLIAATTHAAPVKVALFGDTPAVNESLSKILSSANHAVVPKEQANTADVVILASAEPKPIPGASNPSQNAAQESSSSGPPSEQATPHGSSHSPAEHGSQPVGNSRTV